MTADDAVVAVFAALDAADIPNMLVGSLASNFHGIPRSTRDADFVVELHVDSLQRLEAQLPPDLTIERQSAFEAVTGTPRYVVALAGSPFVCELFVLSDDLHDRQRFARRHSAQVLSHQASVASVEDMIITKLRWARGAHRNKDRDDIRAAPGRDSSLSAFGVESAGSVNSVDFHLGDRPWRASYRNAGVVGGGRRCRVACS